MSCFRLFTEFDACTRLRRTRNVDLSCVAGQRRPAGEPAAAGGGRRRRGSSAGAGRQRHGRGVDEAERGGEALPLAGAVGRQLDAEALPGRRHRLAVARAAQHRQHGARLMIVAVAHRQPVRTGRTVAAAAHQHTPSQSLRGTSDPTNMVPYSSQGCRRGAHLPSLGHSASRRIYDRVRDAWPVRRQTYGYLPSQRALPLPLGQYSFSVPRWVGSSVSLSGWLHAKTVYTRKQSPITRLAVE